MNKKINNNKNIKKYLLTRKKTFLFLCSSIVAFVPIISSTSIYENLNNASFKYKKDYMLGDKKFNSYNDLLDYVNSNSKKINLEGNNSKWTVNLSGVIKTYNDPEKLRDDIYKNIKTRTIKTDVNLSNYANSKGIIGLTNQEAWKHISYDVNSKNTIYQGNNDQTYKSEEEAYKSFFQVKQGYIYNGINFDNKNSLRNYLEKDYFPNKNNNNTVVIVSPSGNSLPIDLTKKGAYDTLSNFIEENSEIRLNYTKNDNNIININKNNISNVIDEVNLKDLNYMHIQSNEGESRYVIDNKDSADLIGPYFYKGILDIPSFTDKNMWRKVSGVSKTVYIESKIDATIGSFFSSIINDDNNLNKIQAEDSNTNTLLFRTLLSTEDNKSYDKWFLDELQKLSPELAKEVIIANNSMMDGKKYNSFYKIPILYNFLMHRAISWGLGLDVINLIIDYFKNVCNFIQDVLEFISLYSDDLLISKNKKNKFNMADFFQIGNPEYDINTSTAYFLDQIKNEYPNLVALSYVYTQAENNISLAGGLIPFKSINFDYLWESKIISADDLYSIKYDLSSVYETFSELKLDDMVKKYVKNNKNMKIKNIESQEPDESKWEEKLKTINTKYTNQNIRDLLSNIGAKNNQYYSLSESILNSEIKMFLETGAIVKGGYLDKLKILSKSGDSLSTFVNFVKKYEENISTYRIYLAFILDLKYNLNIFNNNSTVNYNEFSKRLTYLIEAVFGTVGIVGGTIAKLYSSKNSVPSLGNNPMIELTSYRSGYIIDDIDIDGNKWDKTLNLGQANKDGKLFFADDIFDINDEFINPFIMGNNSISTNQKIVLADLSEGIRNSSTDYDDNLLQLIKESNELRPISRRGSTSVIMDPIDNVSL